jgi:DNA-directed RNA polymerase subunit RPC12/RpoP
MSLRLLRAFDNYFKANILLTRLQSDGVECYLIDENTVTIDPLLSNAIGGIKLMVRESQEEQARSLLRQYEAQTPPQVSCPVCGSANRRTFAEAGPEEWLDGAVSLLFLPGSTQENKEYVCAECGARSGDGPGTRQ